MSDAQKTISILSLVALCCIIPWINVSDFTTRGEPREALVVQSMVSTGNYVLPKSYNYSIPSKPPLFHWLGAAFSYLRGEATEFTVRVPSKVFSILTLLFFVRILSKEFDNKVLVLFTLFLMFSFEWLRAGIVARVDMVHAASLSCGLLAGYRASVTKGIINWALTIALLALSMLSKGPVAIAIPFLVFLTWLILFVPKEKLGKVASRFVLVFFASTVLGLTWYLAAYATYPEEFLAKVWYENVDRMLGSMHDSPHEHSVFFLLGALLIGTLPWSPYILFLLFKNRKKSLYDFKMSLASLTQIEKFSIIVALVTLIFYSIPSSKRGVYLLAIYPFLAILAAVYVDKIRILTTSIIRKLLAACFVITALSQIWISVQSRRNSERPIAEIITNKIPEKERIFSFGHEYYGASFYSGKSFLRLEDWQKEFNPSEAVIILEKPDLEDLGKFLNVNLSSLMTVAELEIGNDLISIVRLKK